MTKKDLGIDYIFFKGASSYLLFMIPITIANVNRIRTTLLVDSHELFESQLIESLQLIKVSISFVLSIVLVYRWALIQSDGTYSFWLAQGVTRTQFLITAFIRFLQVFISIHLIELLLLYLAYGIHFELVDYVVLLPLLTISYFLMLTIGLIIAETTQNPESSAILFIVIFLTNYIFEDNYNEYFSRTVNPDTQLFTDDLQITLILSIALNMVMFSFLFLYNKRRDILY
ncbi:MAG: hypothetical protein ACW98K_00340 [Candidatus Kariarchaeaceae archaeon]|jgi:hypothetical protein